ncbi:MAG: TetR/AcrR family transcriptional regulator, fatty acid metabolism regulator protein [Thermoanaerobaculia bacterium]|nr:TetR/AcrR family transcriptional regulator, fatty acid metabolism regulator protein [Thermoanaerobaculia bacterium]
MLAPMPLDTDTTHTSRSRLLEAGKMLFAQNGYEQTATAAIARAAGSSESQLMRYYGGKAGLLEAIFNQGWLVLNQRMQSRIAASSDAHEALGTILDTMIEVFSADPETAFLFVFEGRRVRAGSEVALSQGFTEFRELLRMVVRRGHRDGTLTDGYNDEALAIALIGAAEALLRERLIARRANQPDPFNDEELRAVFLALLAGLSKPRPAIENAETS